MFADSGMVNMLKSLASMGADTKKLKNKLAGRASMLDQLDTYNIGKRNYAAIR